MTAENKPNWAKHEPSTYSYVGRNDQSVDWVLRKREASDFFPCKKIVVLGSGVIEPFTIAAIPGAEAAEVIAVEIEGNLVGLGQRIKSGETISWQEIADISRHPGTDNSQLLQPARIRKGLEKLKRVGSLQVLGAGVNQDTFQIPQSVTDRVRFVNADSLSGIQGLSDADLICDFFVQTNINKSGEDGLNYTRELIETAVAKLSNQGIYLIGDSGYNHPNTLKHISQIAEAQIGAGSLVHVINKGDRFSSSYYIALTKREFVSAADREQVNQKMASLNHQHDLDIKQEIQSTAELADDVERVLYFAYMSVDGQLTTWSTEMMLPQALLHLTQVDPDFGEKILFPGKA